MYESCRCPEPAPARGCSPPDFRDPAGAAHGSLISAPPADGTVGGRFCFWLLLHI